MAGWGLHDYFGKGIVATELGEQTTINLADGSRVELNTDSRLLVKYNAQARTVVLKSGEAYFNVAHEHRPFVVIAGARKIIAVGTTFTVRRDLPSDDTVIVTLIEGRVAVAPVNSADILPREAIPEVTLLSAGERLRLRAHAPPALDEPPLDKVTSWMRGQLIFDHTPLREAVAEFNRYSATRISVALPTKESFPVGGIFRIGDAKSFALAAAESYHLRLVSRDGEIVLQPAESDPQ